MTEQTADNAAVIDRLNEVWASVVDACQRLRDEQWDLPTDCPGWTVKDQLSHLIGVEHMLLDDPAPEPIADVPSYVRNTFGELNEAWVDARRRATGPEVLAEFVDTTYRRLEALRAMAPEKFDEVGWSPVGQVPYRQFMDTRVFDTWAHEQDIRRALDRPGGRNGTGEALAIDLCARSMAYVVGKKVGPPDGTSVLFAVTGLLGRHMPVVVDGGRARVATDLSDEPTVTLTMDQETFWRLGLGRVAPLDMLASGQVVVAGDVVIGHRVLESMPFTI
jgi:uncharacterized protein (TIGR03083 family)